MNGLVRFSPSTEMRRLQREIDTLFESFFPAREGTRGELEQTGWAPRVDLEEREDAYVMHLDVPGINKEDLEINFQDGTLSISGERKLEQSQERGNFVRVERAYGRFYRAFTLPQTINPESIQANYENGVLTIHVEKAEERKPRRIEVA